MSTGERFSGYPATFGYATAATMSVDQLSGFELTAGNSKTDIIPTGAIDRAAVLTSRTNPEFKLTTNDIKTVLDVVDPQAGKCFDETSTFFLQERADCGTFLAGATQIGLETAKGFMVLETITAEQESDDGAMMTMRYYPQKSGANALVKKNTGDTLIGTPAFNQCYFLGPVYHTGAEIKGVMSVSLNFGINVAMAYGSPGGEPDFHMITARRPEFTFRCLKADNFDAWGMAGIGVTTSFAFYFQKADTTYAVGDGRVAVGTAGHIKISGTAGDFEVTSLSADGQEDAVTEVTLRPTGTISYSSASAIP